MDLIGMSNMAIIREIGSRVKQKRLAINRSQQELAERAGISRKAISELEGGSPITLRTFIRILRALNSLDELEHFLPEPGISPIQKIQMKGKARMRATGKRIRAKTR